MKKFNKSIRTIAGGMLAMALSVILWSCSSGEGEENIVPVAKPQTAVINGKEIPILHFYVETGYDTDYFITLLFTKENEVGDHIKILMDLERFQKKIINLTDRREDATDREWSIHYRKLYKTYFDLTRQTVEKVHCSGGQMWVESDLKNKKYRLIINNLRVKDENYGDKTEYTVSVNAETDFPKYD
jgi:lipoprotein